MNLFEHRISTGSPQQMTKVTGMIREDVEKSDVQPDYIFEDLGDLAAHLR